LSKKGAIKNNMKGKQKYFPLQAPKIKGEGALEVKEYVPPDA
jgi:hypothetical protein